MSIIYDALNKVEKNNSQPSENKTSKENNKNIKLYILYALILILGFIGAKAAVSLVFVAPDKKAEVVKQPKSVVLPVASSSSTPVTQPTQLPVPPVASQPVVSDQVPVKEVKDIEPPPLALNGVFVSPDEKYAIINNQIVREGDKVDGATVLTISENKVDLDYNGLKISVSTSGK